MHCLDSINPLVRLAVCEVFIAISQRQIVLARLPGGSCDEGLGTLKKEERR